MGSRQRLLLGLPRNCLALSSPPSQGFSAPIAEKRWKPFIFAIIFGNFCWLLNLAFISLLLLIAIQILPLSSVAKYTQIKNDFVWETINPLPVIFRGTVHAIIWSIVVSTMLCIIRKTKIDIFLTARITLYASIGTFPMYFSTDNYLIALPWVLFLETLGLHITYNISKSLAFLFALIGGICYVLARRYILAPIIPIDVFTK